MLRPLGTIIVSTVEPSLSCTDSSYSIVKYRVVDYRLALNPKTMKDEIMEELECLSIKQYQPKSVSYVPVQVTQYKPVWEYV